MTSVEWDSESARAVSEAATEADDLLLPLWSDPVDARLRPGRKPILGLDSKATTIAFVARRSYGKSTLINALLDRELLFADWRQATSFPAYISKDEHDLAIIVFDDGRHERIEVCAEAIAAATKQFFSGRKVNARTKNARRLMLSVGHFPLPRGVTLVDIAGFDDSYDTLGSSTTSAALQTLTWAEQLREEALADSDLVIFVLRPDIALGHLEKLMLRHLVDLKGPRGVLPVFNVFVDYETETSEDELREAARAGFEHRRVDDARRRYAAFLREELGIDPDSAFEPVLVAALPALDRRDAGDFGLLDLRARIAELSAGPLWAGADSRAYAAGRALNQSLKFVFGIAELRKGFEEALEANRTIAEINDATAAAWAKWLDEESTNALEVLCAIYDNHLAAAVKEWQEEPGRFWEKSDRLNVAMNAAADRAIADLVEQQLELYNSNWADDDEGVDPKLRKELRRIYARRSHTVLAHDPGFGFFEFLFGEDQAVIDRKAEEFDEDFRWEIDATMKHWRKKRKALRATLEAHLPSPDYAEKVTVPPCPVDMSTDIFTAATECFIEKAEWEYPPFIAGLEAEPLPPIASQGTEAAPDDLQSSVA